MTTSKPFADYLGCEANVCRATCTLKIGDMALEIPLSFSHTVQFGVMIIGIANTNRMRGLR
jgi:hypothetical protein